MWSITKLWTAHLHPHSRNGLNWPTCRFVGLTALMWKVAFIAVWCFTDTVSGADLGRLKWIIVISWIQSFREVQLNKLRRLRTPCVSALWTRISGWCKRPVVHFAVYIHNRLKDKRESNGMQPTCTLESFIFVQCLLFSFKKLWLIKMSLYSFKIELRVSLDPFT